MRILSRFLAKLCRSNEARLGGCLAVGIVLASPSAAAQPAPRAPAPSPAQGAPPAETAPAAAQPSDAPAAAQPSGAPTEEPLMPPAAPPPQQEKAPEAPAAAPNPDRDARALVKQGEERPTSAGEVGARPSDVYAEDWWSQARPVFEIHGYYRVRAELFHNFALGRKDAPPLLFPQPIDNYVERTIGTNQAGQPVQLCGDDPTTSGPQGTMVPCENNTHAGANMRFRVNPELHISDNLRVMAQVDMLDNVVLGSTPEGYYNLPATGGYQVGSRGGYTPLGFFSSTQWTPKAGVNATRDSISVKRVWGEYTTPFGLLRFGRMPNHWGLGMLYNSGDGYDADWQSTVDRIMVVSGIKKYDLYFAGAWDFANEGATSARYSQFEGQPYDLGQLDDVNQYSLIAVRRRNPELQKLDLARGNLVVNGGVYFTFRNQVLANDITGASNSASLNQTPANVSTGLVRRGAQSYVPDLWLQLLYRKFRFEIEAAMVYGSIDSTVSDPNARPNYASVGTGQDSGWKLRQFGLAAESEFRAIEDRLRIQFGFGWASGDPDMNGFTPSGASTDRLGQLTRDRTYSTFAFHPNYRVDLILWRNILTRVQGAYYFRPSVEYDFARNKNGQRLGGGAAAIWSRASEFIQTPGHARDLGIELDAKLYFQSKDGTLNDDPDKMGGFYTFIQYGVLFPLGGFSYLPDELTGVSDTTAFETKTAQTLRWFMGILY